MSKGDIMLKVVGNNLTENFGSITKYDKEDLSAKGSGGV